jgi:hypothetical protein
MAAFIGFLICLALLIGVPAMLVVGYQVHRPGSWNGRNKCKPPMGKR